MATVIVSAPPSRQRGVILVIVLIWSTVVMSLTVVAWESAFMHQRLANLAGEKIGLPQEESLEQKSGE